MGQIVCVTDRNLVAVERNRLLLPPTFTHYFTWGYPDHSGKIALVEGDRVRGGVERRGERKRVEEVVAFCHMKHFAFQVVGINCWHNIFRNASCYCCGFEDNIN